MFLRRVITILRVVLAVNLIFVNGFGVGQTAERFVLERNIDNLMRSSSFWTGMLLHDDEVWVNLAPYVQVKEAISDSIKGTRFGVNLLSYDLQLKLEAGRLMNLYDVFSLDEGMYRVWLDVSVKGGRILYNVHIQDKGKREMGELKEIEEKLSYLVANGIQFSQMRDDIYGFCIGKIFSQKVFPRELLKDIHFIETPKNRFFAKLTIAEYHRLFFSKDVAGGIRIKIDGGNSVRQMPFTMAAFSSFSLRTVMESLEVAIGDRMKAEDKLKVFLAYMMASILRYGLSKELEEEFNNMISSGLVAEEMDNGFLQKDGAVRQNTILTEMVKVLNSKERGDAVKQTLVKVIDDFIDFIEEQKRENSKEEVVARLEDMFGDFLELFSGISLHFARYLGNSFYDIFGDDRTMGYFSPEERRYLQACVQMAMIDADIFTDLEDILRFPPEVDNLPPFFKGISYGCDEKNKGELPIKGKVEKMNWEDIAVIWGYMVKKKYSSKKDKFFQEIFSRFSDKELLYKRLLTEYHQIAEESRKNKRYDTLAMFLEIMAGISWDLLEKISEESRSGGSEAVEIIRQLWQEGEYDLLHQILVYDAEKRNSKLISRIISSFCEDDWRILLFIFSSCCGDIGKREEIVEQLGTKILSGMKKDGFDEEDIGKGTSYIFGLLNEDITLVLSVLHLLFRMEMKTEKMRYGHLLVEIVKNDRFPKMVRRRAYILLKLLGKLPDDIAKKEYEFDFMEEVKNVKRYLLIDGAYKDELLKNAYLSAGEILLERGVGKDDELCERELLSDMLKAKFSFSPTGWANAGYELNYLRIHRCRGDYIILTLGHEIGHNVGIDFSSTEGLILLLEGQRFEEMKADICGAILLLAAGKDPISIWRAKVQVPIDESSKRRIYQRNAQVLYEWMVNVRKERINLQEALLFLLKEMQSAARKIFLAFWFGRENPDDIYRAIFSKTIEEKRIKKGLPFSPERYERRFTVKSRNREKEISRRKFLQFIGTGVGLAVGGAVLYKWSKFFRPSPKETSVVYGDIPPLQSVSGKIPREQRNLHKKQESVKGKKRKPAKKKDEKPRILSTKEVKKHKKELLSLDWGKLTRDEFDKWVNIAKSVCISLKGSARNQFLWELGSKSTRVGLELLRWIVEEKEDWLGNSAFLPLSSELPCALKMTEQICKRARKVIREKGVSSYRERAVSFWKQKYASSRSQPFIEYLANPFWVFPVVVGWMYMRNKIKGTGHFNKSYYSLAEVMAFLIKEGYDKVGMNMKEGNVLSVTNEFPMGLDRFGSNKVREKIYEEKWLPDTFGEEFLKETGRKMSKNNYPLIYFCWQGILGPQYPAILALIAMMKQDEEDLATRGDLKKVKIIVKNYYKLPESTRIFIRYLLYNAGNKIEKKILTSLKGTLMNKSVFPSWVIRKWARKQPKREKQVIAKAKSVVAMASELSLFTGEDDVVVGRREILTKLANFVFGGIVGSGVVWNFGGNSDDMGLDVNSLNAEREVEQFLNDYLKLYDLPIVERIEKLRETNFYKVMDFIYRGILEGREDEEFKRTVDMWMSNFLERILQWEEFWEKLSEEKAGKNAEEDRFAEIEILDRVHIGDWILRVIEMGHRRVFETILSQKQYQGRDFTDILRQRIFTTARAMAFYRKILDLSELDEKDWEIMAFVSQLDYLADAEVLRKLGEDIFGSWEKLNKLVAKGKLGKDVEFLSTSNSFLVVAEKDGRLYLLPLAQWIERYAKLCRGMKDDFDGYLNLLEDMVGLWGKEDNVVYWEKKDDMFSIDMGEVNWIETREELIDAWMKIREKGMEILGIIEKENIDGKRSFSLILGTAKESATVDEIFSIVDEAVGDKWMREEEKIELACELNLHPQVVVLDKWIKYCFGGVSEKVKEIARQLREKREIGGIRVSVEAVG